MPLVRIWNTDGIVFVWRDKSQNIQGCESGRI